MSRHCYSILGLPRMVLNWDVLFLIMEFVDRCSLLPYVQTCHTLYKAGVPHLLRVNTPIYFGKHLNVKSFCHFILGEFPSRLRYLREVEFPKKFWLRKKDTISQLAEVLRNAPFLEKVTISAAERFFEIGPELGAALREATSIRELSLDGVGDQALSVLTRMRSPLNSVELCADAVPVADCLDPNKVLASFSSSLRQLKVRWVQFENTSIQYPHVHTLSIEDDNFVPMDMLIHVFPNLQSLSITTNTGVELDEEEALHIHNENMRAQARLSWPSLNYLEGDVMLLYCLAPTCKVRCLSVWPSSSDVARLVQVCKSTRPESIKIYFHMDKLSVEELRMILRSTDVKHLSATIDAYDVNGLKDIRAYIHQLRDLFQTLTITTLYFRFIWHPTPTEWFRTEHFETENDDESSLVAPLRTPNPVQQYLHSLNVKTCMRKTADYIKTLRYAFFDMPGKPMSYWEIFRTEEGTISSFEQFSNEAGEQIVQETF
ncbi:unnamed protein product [Somion occarium]